MHGRNYNGLSNRTRVATTVNQGRNAPTCVVRLRLVSN